jgi:HEAT repeat protein
MNAYPRPVFRMFALLLLVAESAPAKPQLTHEQALQDLDQPYSEARRRAVARLGEIGVMSDTPALLKRLRNSDGFARKLAEIVLWQVWRRSGDEKIDARLQQGLAQMHEGPVRLALATFNKIIELKPDLAEGWNKRATLYFIMGKEVASRLR